MKPTIRRLAQLSADERDRLMRRSLDQIFAPDLWASVRSLYEDVAAAGDGALCAALQRFDGVDAQPGDLRVSEQELDAAGAALAPALRAALDSMIAALRRYNERVLRDADWREEIAPGIEVGERARPIASAALYVPSGKGSFPSVMAHLGVPAVVAGVPKIVVLCPPLRATGRVDPASLYIAAQLGLREIWRVNGPTGIAAAVLGTASIPRARKIVGPGSPAVTVAQLLGAEHGVATNMLQGPSESLIVADDSADARLLALDLLTEAEHGADSAATLLTWSEALAERVASALEPLLAALPETQREHAVAVLRGLGGIVICADEDEACAFANEYAVEHLQIATADPEDTLTRIDHAAEILIGQTTPMAAANFTIGVPNTLPSGGYAAVSSGVTARTFLATSSIARLSADGLAAVGPAARVIAEYEEFPAHAGALEGRGL
ncbi:MAG: histidinol dehydrogenase [Gaiellaceae bacterium]|nr:histidinol dehydrogenase [Gaiellaceae bacterium]